MENWITFKIKTGSSQVTNTKIDDLLIKLYFRSSSPCITYLFVPFTGGTNIQKF